MPEDLSVVGFDDSSIATAVQPALTTVSQPVTEKGRLAVAALLDVSGVVMRFGGVTAVGGVSFTVGQRSICGLIGPNGAGKTTLFNCISGIYRPSEGRIAFDGREITGAPRHRMAGLGIGRTFQNVALFRTLMVVAAIGTVFAAGYLLWLYQKQYLRYQIAQ